MSLAVTCADCDTARCSACDRGCDCEPRPHLARCPHDPTERVTAERRELLRRAIDATTRERLEPPSRACPGCGGSILEGCHTLDCSTCLERRYRREHRRSVAA